MSVFCQRLISYQLGFLLGLTLLLAGCTFSVQDTPELRDRISAYNSGNPLPPLPADEPTALCADILGNINAAGEKIYHLPGQANYNNVKPEAYFCSEEEAQEAGYRKSQR